MAHPLNVYSSVVFSVFMRLGNNFHTIQFQTVFITPQNKPHTHWQPLPVPPYPHPLTTANLLFVSRDLPLWMFAINGVRQWVILFTGLFH